jgi:hypothetical protein
MLKRISESKEVPMRNMLCVVLCFAVFLGGCMGREPNPVPIKKPGDESRNCESLKSEVVQLQKDMLEILPKTDKFGTNAVLATTGVLLIVPFFFMDLKDAEGIEFEAMRQRNNHLLEILKTKNCDVSDIMAEPIPSLEQQKEEVEEMLKHRANL